MFSMDLSEMDRLKDLLFRASAQSDEAFYILKQLCEETETDVNLKTFDSEGVVNEDIRTAMAALTRVKESLRDLGVIVAESAEQCAADESEKASVISGDIS